MIYLRPAHNYGSSIHFTVWTFCPRGVVWVILTHTTQSVEKVTRKSGFFV